MVIRLLRVNIQTYTTHNNNIIIRSIENDTTSIKYRITYGEKLYFGDISINFHPNHLGRFYNNNN